ncbi:MAG: MFS transporter [Opitutaceae bacterium]|nr:MFS transporter [Opitutaceae bacterium]
MSITPSQKLSVWEKAGYSAGDAAANFVFMTMVLFQLNFYTDVFGLSADVAAAILLWPRLWDALFDPLMGILADRTRTRWGRFRPWILWTSLPWAVVMVLAYTTPEGWGMGMMIAYAGITNAALMTLYSMNNMPYSALGGVMTGDADERTRLNSYRFVSVTLAQFVVGGFTLPLVAKFSQGHDRQHGWQVTMTLWAALCLVLFIVTFLSTRERIQPVAEVRSTPRQDFRDLLRNGPWLALVCYTLLHFALLAYRGGALYNYYHHYADKTAMFDFVARFGLTADFGAPRQGLLDFLGYIVRGGPAAGGENNVADVFNSIVNMLGTATTIVGIVASTGFSARFGRKRVALFGFSLSAMNAFAFYLLPSSGVGGMVLLTFTGSLVYAPTIAVMWAMYADAADFSEWQTGRRFTGMVFATIGFSLKAGLAIGSAAFLWLMEGVWNYDTRTPAAADAIAGYHFSSSISVGFLFFGCVLCIAMCGLNRTVTRRMGTELAARRSAATA